ncbi:MAG TPA: helix-turn-helix domain-containing protein [Candidatus Angelobacter sp.]|nr:helix-turn-helix domain-containing protein [Candidatus Angelobacter sp.]
MAQPIALRQLAEVAGVSARLFERAFRQAMGSPPHAYVMERRLATARDRLLSCPKLVVGEIARRTWVQQLQPSCCGISSSDRVLPHDISATPVALTEHVSPLSSQATARSKKERQAEHGRYQTRSLRMSA